MFRDDMNNKTLPSQYFLGRSAFQSIFHAALIADENDGCLGLLGALKTKPQNIIFVAEVATAEVLEKRLERWRLKGVQCVGSYRMKNMDAPTYISQSLEDRYIDLRVDLDEKGRLDLLAYHHYKGENDGGILSLNLIEDGQQVSDA